MRGGNNLGVEQMAYHIQGAGSMPLKGMPTDPTSTLNPLDLQGECTHLLERGEELDLRLNRTESKAFEKEMKIRPRRWAVMMHTIVSKPRNIVEM